MIYNSTIPHSKFGLCCICNDGVEKDVVKRGKELFFPAQWDPKLGIHVT